MGKAIKICDNTISGKLCKPAACVCSFNFIDFLKTEAPKYARQRVELYILVCSVRGCGAEDADFAP